MTNPHVDEFWEEFVSKYPDYRGKPYLLESFGDSPILANELGELIASGKKTATCSAVWSYQAERVPFPKEGSIIVVLNGHNEPLCVIKTVKVTFCAFNEVTEDFARAEGEGDLTLANWRENHARYFTRTLEEIGKTFSEDIPLLCERFVVLYSKG